VYTVGNQTIGGVKTFSSNLKVEKSLNGDPQLIFVTNPNSGTATEAVIYVGNAALGATSATTFMQTLGTGFSSTGGFIQDGSVIGTGTDISGGLSLMVRANADMRFYTNGHTNQRMAIKADGNVGIGTTSPSVKLDVGGASNSDSTARFSKTSEGTLLLGGNRSTSNCPFIGSENNFDFAFITNNTEKMRISSAGQIQFTSTGQPPITNSLYGNMVLTTNAVGNFQRIRFDVGTTAYWGLTKLNTGNFAITGGSTWNDHAFSIQYSTQNVGVGMSSGVFPGKFNVSANSGTTTPGVGDGIFVGPYQGNAAVGSNWAYSNSGHTYTDFCSRYDSSSSYMRFIMKASATPVYAMTIRGNGDVGIGTDGSGNIKLKVYKTARNDNYIAQFITHTGRALSVGYDGISNNTSYGLVMSTALAGGYHIGAWDSSNNGAFFIYNNGNIENQNNSYGQYSDIKLKENVVDASPKLDDLLKVKVKNFNFIGSELKQIGVIAQELEEVFPGLVEDKPDTERDEVTNQITELETTTKSVKYSVFTPMLIKAIQEQQAQIELLKQEVELLKQ
jgi:hypothetical protein